MASTTPQQAAPAAPIDHNARYYASDTYALPSDAEEAERLQLQHGSIRAVFDDRIVLAPLELKPGDEVLEIGTGKGAWALDFVATYPNADKAQILCIDIEPGLFPAHPPPNTRFETGNVFEIDIKAWENRFAFVHQRLLIAAFKAEQWQEVVDRIYSITAPGGWVQMLEANLYNHVADSGPATHRAMEVYAELDKALGTDLNCAPKLKDWMEKAGFVDVDLIVREAPLDTLSKANKDSVANIMSMWRGLKSPILRLGGFGLINTEQDFDTLMDEMEKEWQNPGAKVGWYVATGRKA